MQKIRLDLDELEVDSFAIAAQTEVEGTVLSLETGVQDCDWSFVGTPCSNTVWEAGCSFVTAPLDCRPTEGPYSWCTEI